MQDKLGSRFVGHVLIKDAATDETLVDKFNAINAENMSFAIAQSLANRPAGYIQSMVFGNGASTVSGIGTVTYFPPNVTGMSATLYNQTYSKVIDDLSPLNTDPTNNFLRVQHTQNTTFTDIVITCMLNNNEPADQNATDNATNEEDDYVFDELGLMSYDPSGTGLLLSHVIFNPVQKALNRAIQIVYTVRVYMS